MSSSGDDAAAPGTPLSISLRGMIGIDGPLPLDRYMDLCLSHQTAGYYMTRDPFGRGGDFITAPEISQIFGELIGLWCAHVWTTMGSPSLFNLAELGPGRGTLMADLLRAAGKVPGFPDAAEIALVETSPTLRRRQSETLNAHADVIAWHEHISTVPDGPAIIVANELLDALPVRQFERTDRGWFERGVGLDDHGQLSLGLLPGTAARREIPAHAAEAPEGTIFEISPAIKAMTTAIAERLARSGGAALFIDYGYCTPGTGDTMQAVSGHEYIGILERPGECDITAHVDFSAVAGAAKQAGAQVFEPVTQAHFLNALGIGLRADALKAGASDSQRSSIDRSVARLTDTDKMGEMFKVMAIAAPDLPPPPPFGVSE